MSEYYGVSTPTSDFLAHYGIRGMKWGVRKARETGNVRRLSRNYNKAVKKLAKLRARTDRDIVTKAKKQNLREAPVNAAIGGLVSGLGTFAINKHMPMASRAKYAAAVGGGMALANGISSAAINARYKRMLSDKGRKKNLVKSREFEKEARKSFKGTQYAKSLDSDVRKNVENTRRYFDLMAPGGAKKQAKAKVINKPNTSGLSRKDRRDVNQAMKNWADAFEKHYQTGLSKGMSHEQAERYSNNYIAEHGFKPVRSAKKHR